MTAHKKAAGEGVPQAASKTIYDSNFNASVLKYQFLQAAHLYGIKLTGTIIADGTLHRCHLDNQRAGSKNGAYILHLDGCPAGWAYDFTTGHSFNWRADGKRVRLSDADRAAIAAERKRRENERQQAHRSAAGKARNIWAYSKPIIRQSDHPYLVKKRIEPHGARLSIFRGLASVVVPIMNDSGVASLQFIDEFGSKRFLHGGQIQGGYFGIGMANVTLAEPGRILICEGFATGASLHEWFKQPVIIAFNAGNMEPVAKRIKQLYPNDEIIICGDNDESGTGQKAARAAALVCGGCYLLPPIIGQDFNDAINTWRDAAGKEAGV